MKTSDYQKSLDRLRQAAHAYYSTGSSDLSDSEYDALVSMVRMFEDENGLASDVTGSVGAGYSPSGNSVAHIAPMLSLANEYSLSDVATWVERRSAAFNDDTESLLWSVEPKVDGSAIAITYEDGVPSQMITRGDGVSGEDISHNLDLIELPMNVSLGGVSSFVVRGEVVFTETQFDTASRERVAAGRSAFKNPRNAAAGVLSTDLDHRSLHNVRMTFICYDAFGIAVNSSVEMGDVLSSAGFLSTIVLGSVVPTESVSQAVEDMASRKSDFGFELDGVVIKAVSFDVRDALGLNSRTPRWATAYKWPNSTVTSTVEGIELAVGKSGKITFTALLSPTDIDGVTISRATLHNLGFIRDQGIGVGSTVTLERAASVIPRVTAGVGGEFWQAPTECPSCQGVIVERGVDLVCESPSCALPRWLEYAASRDALDIDGVSAGFVAAALEVFPDRIVDLADFLSLTREDIATIPGYEARAGDIAFDAIRTSIQAATFDRLLISLALPLTGRSMSRRIAMHFGSLEAVRSASVEEMSVVEKMGPKKSAMVVDRLAELGVLLDRLVDLGFATEIEVGEPAETVSSELTGMICYVTGKMPLKKAECQAIVERLGGVFKQSSKLDVIIGAPSAKVDKFVAKGARHIDVAEFEELAQLATGANR